MTDRFKSKVKRLMAGGCPSKEEAVAICEAEAQVDVRAARRILSAFEARGGKSLRVLRRELGLE